VALQTQSIRFQFGETFRYKSHSQSNPCLSKYSGNAVLLLDILRSRKVEKSYRASFGKLVKLSGYCSKPDFIIIGAQKAGTTALHQMLRKHSAVTASWKKEVHYFNNDKWYNRLDSIHQYHSFFPLPFLIPERGLLFETSPGYLCHPEAAGRMYRYNPDLKLIAILRDPAQRALSAWTMFHYHFESGYHRRLHDTRLFGEAIAAEIEEIRNSGASSRSDRSFSKRPYVKPGIYHEQLRQYFDVFPREQILVLESKALKQQWENTSKSIAAFLGIPYEAIPQMEHNSSRVSNKGSYPGELGLLREFYKPHNATLYELLGCEYDWDR